MGRTGCDSRKVGPHVTKAGGLLYLQIGVGCLDAYPGDFTLLHSKRKRLQGLLLGNPLPPACPCPAVTLLECNSPGLAPCLTARAHASHRQVAALSGPVLKKLHLP